MTACHDLRKRYLSNPYRPALPVTDNRFRWLDTFVTPGQAVEVTDVNLHEGFGGVYGADHLNDIAGCAGRATGPARDLHVSLNPLTPAVLDRGPNRLAAISAGCDDILALAWLPVAVQSFQNQNGLDSAVVAAAGAVAGLGLRGWPVPVIAHAWNELHLLYGIDLPTDGEDLVERVLMGIGNRYGTRGTDVRQDMYTANAIVPAYGLPFRSQWAGGIGVPPSSVIHIPADLRVVPADTLESIAREGGNEAHDGAGAAKLGPAFTGRSRSVTPRDTLQRARHCLRLLLPPGSDRLPARPHAVACRLLADKGLLFSEAIPILTEWDLSQPSPVGVAKLEVELIAAMNGAWEEIPGLKDVVTD